MSNFPSELLVENKNNKECFGERLEFIIKEKGISKQWLANKLGISKQALNYLINHSIKPKFVDQFSEILNVDPYWLEFGMSNPIAQDVIEFIEQKIPVYNSNSIINYLKSGLTENIQEHTYFKHKNIENIIAFKLSSDCLFPPIIENSILFFDTQKKPDHEDFVLLLLENTVLIRQLILEGINISYYAPNQKYQSFTNLKCEIKGTLIEARYSLKDNI